MVYLVRHGETEWNREGVFRGRRDIPLSPHGILQAERTGAYMRDMNLSAVYTSPLRRAAHTAELISAETGAPVIIREGLTDVSYGEWEGMNEVAVRKKYPDLIALYETDPQKACFPSGESLAGCFERCYREFALIAESETTVAIVTHRVILKLIILGVLGLGPSSFWRVQVDTCSISELRKGNGGTANGDTANGDIVIRSLNRTPHLGGSRKGPDF